MRIVYLGSSSGISTHRADALAKLGQCAEVIDPLTWLPTGREHMELYEEVREAVFWSDAAECVGQCMALLADEPRRQAIAAASHARALHNGHYIEQVMARILEAAIGNDRDPVVVRGGQVG